MRLYPLQNLPQFATWAHALLHDKLHGKTKFHFVDSME